MKKQKLLYEGKVKKYMKPMTPLFSSFPTKMMRLHKTGTKEERSKEKASSITK